MQSAGVSILMNCLVLSTLVLLLSSCSTPDVNQTDKKDLNFAPLTIGYSWEYLVYRYHSFPGSDSAIKFISIISKAASESKFVVMVKDSIFWVDGVGSVLNNVSTHYDTCIFLNSSVNCNNLEDQMYFFNLDINQDTLIKSINVDNDEIFYCQLTDNAFFDGESIFVDKIGLVKFDLTHVGGTTIIEWKCNLLRFNGISNTLYKEFNSN